MNIPFLTPITVWSRWCLDEHKVWGWEHNHLEEGNCPNPLPTPKHDNHLRAWPKGKWLKKFCFLTENNIVV